MKGKRLGRVVEGLNEKEGTRMTDFIQCESVDAKLQKVFDPWENSDDDHLSVEKILDVNKGCTGGGGGCSLL